MKIYVDLNSDMGEGFADYKLGEDAALLDIVTSANIACGWHAGDPLIMNTTVKEALRKGVAVGAHPGFPDLMGFGRRSLDVSPKEAALYTLYQTGALSAFSSLHGGELQHIKLHGALYNMASVSEPLSEAITDAVQAWNPSIILMGLSGSLFLKKAEEKGLKTAHEVFADRAYNRDGTLVSRKQPGALITDPKAAVERVLQMVLEKKVRAVTGELIPIQADSICVHGDNPEALRLAETIRSQLENSGIRVQPLHTFL
ncbi:MAG: 5-oxoprolinase subunit PxpA [Bacillota bacterium]|nr:5-oxoprolinase subunit PxpA [Bacillota bacterium]